MASQDGDSRPRAVRRNRKADGRTDLSADLSAVALAKAEALAKVDAERKAADERAARAAEIAKQRVAAADRKAEQRRERNRKEQIRRDFNRTADDKKAAEQKQAAAKQEAQKRADERKAAANAPERQKGRQPYAMPPQFAALRALRARSADEVREDFKRQNADLLDGQKQQLSAASKQRTRERDSFAVNRDEAIRHHAGRIQEIDGREKQAAIELAKKHDSVAGRLSAFTKQGRDRQAQERSALAQKFETQRMTQHRDLAARQERQADNEQKARLRYGLELKTMREGHVATRREQSVWQDNNLNRLVKERVNIQREHLGREFNRAAQENTLTRAFNPAPSGFPVPKHRQQQPDLSAEALAKAEQQQAQERDLSAVALAKGEPPSRAFTR
jgi:hypothetical protein